MRRADYHEARAHHEGELANHNRAMAKLHGEAMGKAVAGNPEHDFHKSAKAEHEAVARAHDAQQAVEAKCQKAAEAADLAKSQQLEPTRVFGVIPATPGITPIPRYGQRSMHDAVSVAPEFAKIIGTNPEDLDAEERSLR